MSADPKLVVKPSNLEEYSDFNVIKTTDKATNPLPKWCEPEPNLKEYLELLNESWKLLGSGTSQGYRQYRFLNDRSPSTLKITNNTGSAVTSTSSSNTPNLTSITSVNTPGNRQSETQSSLTPEHKGNENKNIIHTHISSKESGGSTQLTLTLPGTLPEKELKLDQDQERPLNLSPTLNVISPNTPRVASEAFVFFFDTFYEKILSKDTNLLKFRLPQKLDDRMKFLNKFCKTILNMAPHWNKPQQFTKELCELILEHDQYGLIAEDYDCIGITLLETVVHCLGNDNKAVYFESWRLAYSLFLVHGLQYINSTRTVHVVKQPLPLIYSDFSKPAGDDTVSAVTTVDTNAQPKTKICPTGCSFI